jgi:DNA helicase-2/ATP-dependent DNA helicase PcrA
VSLVELCRRILDRAGVWQEVEALDDAARLSARLNLYRFLDLAEEWSPIEGAPSLEAFIDYLDLLVEDRATDELDTARVSGEDAVALLTVHRAKGLEWPVVFLPALCDGVFPSRSRRFEDPHKHPQFLPHDYRLDRDWLPALPDDPKDRTAVLRSRHMDQEWRTAYVAVTRAAARLVCTGAWWYTEKVPKKPSRLYELAATAGTVSRTVVEPGEPPETLRFPVDDAAPPDPVFPSGWLAALREAIRDPEAPRRRAADLGVTRAYDAEVDQLRLTLDGLPDPPEPPTAEEGFRTSVTALVTFASCPQRFYWSEVDRLPRRPSPGMRAGVELHRRIELHNRGTVPLEEVTETFYDAPEDVDPAAVEGGFAAFRRSRFASLRPRWVEAPFELKMGQARVAGRIDAIYEHEPGTWEIVDFKAGRRRDDPALEVQLQAYALAARHAGFAVAPPERIVVTFAYLGGGLDESSTPVDDEWLAAAERRVSDLVSGAVQGVRSATPGEGCRRCDFAQFCEAGRDWLQVNA